MDGVKDFVNREIIYCCSSLITELNRILPDNNEYYEDLLNLSFKKSYNYNFHSYYCDELNRELYRVVCERPGEPISYVWVHESNYDLEIGEDDDIKDAILEEYFKTIGLSYLKTKFDLLEEEEEPEFEEEIEEVLEHYIVTNWLAEKLEAKNEVVCFNFMGFTIWGRTTSGSAIYMDEVIQEIFEASQRG